VQADHAVDHFQQLALHLDSAIMQLPLESLGAAEETTEERDSLHT
jgi:hypothetical protein